MTYRNWIEQENANHDDEALPDDRLDHVWLAYAPAFPPRWRLWWERLLCLARHSRQRH